MAIDKENEIDQEEDEIFGVKSGNFDECWGKECVEFFNKMKQEM